MAVNGSASGSRPRRNATSLSEPFYEVYIKNLDDWYDTADKVKQLCQPYGLVTHVHLVRKDTEELTGVAYVTYAEPEMALKACHKLNGIRNRHGHGLFVDRAFTRRQWHMKTGIYRLWVSNLHPKVDNQELYDRFSRYGSIIVCKVNRNDEGQSVGTAIVVFMEQEAADRAIKEGDGTHFFNRPCFVSEFHFKRQRPQNQTQSDRKLFVKSITDVDDLRKVFERYGIITEVTVIPYRGFGYVTFKEKEMAERALANKPLLRKMVPNPDFDISWAQPEKVTDDHRKECIVCMDRMPPESVASIGCNHDICRECLQHYLEIMILDGSGKLFCPENGCRQAIDPSVIEDSVPADVLEKYQSQLRNGGPINEPAYRAPDRPVGVPGI